MSFDYKIITLLLLMLSSLLLMNSYVNFAICAEKPPKTKRESVFLSRKKMKKVSVFLPKSLNFSFRKVSRNSNIKIFEGFPFIENIVEDARYVSKNYLNVFIVFIVMAVPINSENFRGLNNISKHQIIQKGHFDFANRSYWWETKQVFPSISYKKIFSVFGNQFQTILLASVYDTKLEKSFIASLMKRVAYASIISDTPFE